MILESQDDYKEISLGGGAIDCFICLHIYNVAYLAFWSITLIFDILMWPDNFMKFLKCML